jgi:hypothetical protein
VDNSTNFLTIFQQAKMAINIFKWGTLTLPINLVLVVLGNFFSIAAFLVHRDKWAKHHVYMFVMSICDTFSMTHKFLYFFLYLGLSHFTNDQMFLNIMGDDIIFCKLSQIVGNISIACSNTLPLCLVFDRLHAFYFPFNYRIRTTYFSKKVALAICLTNAILYIPLEIYIAPYKIYNIHLETVDYCWINRATAPDFINFYDIIVNNLFFQGIIPMVVLFIANVILIFKTIKIIKGSLGIKSQQKADKDLKNATQSAISTIMMSLLYIIANIPAAVLRFITIYRNTTMVYANNIVRFIDIFRFIYTSWFMALLVSII